MAPPIPHFQKNETPAKIKNPLNVCKKFIFGFNSNRLRVNKLELELEEVHYNQQTV